MTKGELWKKGFISACSLLKGNQDRNLEAGTEAETTGECCLLACSLGRAQPGFYTT